MEALHIHDAYGGTHFELLMRDMEAFLLMAMQESIAVRKEERSSTEVRFSPFPSGLNLLGGKIMLLLEYILKSSCKNSEDFTCAWVYYFYCAWYAEGEEIWERR